MSNKKFHAEEELANYNHLFNRMCYNLLKEPLFQSFGLELSAAAICLETNDTFAMKGLTFGYFNPIDQSVHVNIEDPFFATCTNDVERKAKLCFILFHEMYHKILKHDTRANNREHTLWNISADCEVHNMMYLYKECCVNNEQSFMVNEFKAIAQMLENANNPKFEPNPDKGEYAFMFDKHYLNNVAEEIYAALLNSKKVSQQSFQLDLNKMMGNSQSSQSQQDQNQTDNGNGNSSQDGEDQAQNGQSQDDNNSDGQDADGNADSKNNANDKNQNSKGQNQSNGSNQGQKQNSNSKQNSKSKQNSNGDSNDTSDSNQLQGQAGNDQNGSSSSGTSVTVTQTTYQLPNGRTFTDTDIKWPDMSQLPDKFKKSKDQLKRDEENAELRRQVMEQNLKKEVERSKGNISADCNAFLKKLFKVKIDWEKILKTSLQTVLAKSDYFSWARPRRTTMTLDLPYLPDMVEDNSGYGKIFICVDQSGSMSDQEFQKISNIILDAKDHYKKIVVIQHDTSINNVFEFDDINDDVLKKVFTRTSCGGTSHSEVFKYIANDWLNTKFDDENKISAVIVCSDCCSDIQDEQKQLSGEIPMIYLVPEHCQEYTKGIRGKVIEVA